MTGRLGRELRAMIRDEGPIGVDRFMLLALSHPSLGYYATREPLGAEGDFVTAPEVSQMFGEMVGAWATTVWASMGAPDPVRLVEIGPGRGTMMADALRVARLCPGFFDALDLHFVETSPVLRAEQQARLAGCGRPTAWHGSVDVLPSGPVLVLANEFFDALPVRHFVRQRGGWHERLVGLVAGELAFGLAPEPERALRLEAPNGAVVEVGLAAQALARTLAARFVREGGAALVLDYGYAVPAFAETLQAIRRHRYVDPLSDPGEADLTAHVDFGALARAAEGVGAAVHGPVPQGGFLRALGIEARAEALKRGAPARTGEIEAALARLTGAGSTETPGMGVLFKALCIAAPGLPVPPGFTAPVDTAEVTP